MRRLPFVTTPHVNRNGATRPTVVGCACPDCGSPLTVRVWLRLADCWNCGASIELGAERLDEDAPIPDGNRPGIREAAQRPQTTTNSTATLDPQSLGDDLESEAWWEQPGWDSQDAEPDVWLDDSAELGRRPVPLKEIPAWLASLLFHLALLLLLALFTWRSSDDEPRITLALEIGGDGFPGDRAAIVNAPENRYDLPAPMDELPDDVDPELAMERADQDARKIRIDPLADAPNLPSMPKLQQRIRSADPHERALSWRDPRLRVMAIRQEGGTTLTEAAVARGLAWLAKQQRDNGSWSLEDGGHRGAATSLALLPFLGAGQTHLTGVYSDHVGRGLRFLLDRQRPNGDLRIDDREQFGMYVHGQATIVLCEALAMTQDERLRDPAQRAIEFIEAAQHPRGGWRYEPGEEGDTSVLGWQVMALQSAKSAGLQVSPDAFDLAGQYLEMAQSQEGATYAYQPGHSPTHVMSAEGLLCRIYLGWNLSDPPLRHGAAILWEENPPSLDEINYYYWYYATQVLHHHGGRLWEGWNQALRNILVGLQENSGRHAGSWPIEGPHADVGGRIYCTSLAICTLEVYYRHAPIFRRLGPMPNQ